MEEFVQFRNWAAQSPKMSADPGITWIANAIPEMHCAQSWNVAPIIVGNLHYSHRSTIDSSAVAVIWRRENDKFLGKFEGALEFCWRNEVINPWTRLLRFSAVSYNCITAVLSQWVGFLPWEIWLPSPGKASCNRVLLPNLWCMLGVLMFP